jgi:hypothetical protein
MNCAHTICLTAAFLGCLPACLSASCLPVCLPDPFQSAACHPLPACLLPVSPCLPACCLSALACLPAACQPLSACLLPAPSQSAYACLLPVCPCLPACCLSAYLPACLLLSFLLFPPLCGVGSNAGSYVILTVT